ncbi:MAG: hypothetical protein LBC85_03290 [Fibromonadaceae bacterium]|jgi:ribonuclease J|nr:hypothetical protein [Fibromonadaceae bacterium]
MQITIHRGANQIGGCVTEISTEKARVFIDLGADLTKDKEKSVSKINIDGLTTGNAEKSVLLLTHYHGDHIGRITQAKPSIPIYMGKTAKKINMTLKKRLLKSERISEEERKHYEKEIELFTKTKNLEPGKEFILGDIKITPIMIDHSAFDAYSFLLEANGTRIFYTGDFRLHGPRGKIKVFKCYAKNIDYLICEGTNILKTKKAQTEYELQQKAMELFRNPKHKYVFILCASTNIDRIFLFYNAYNKTFEERRPFICDKYQKKILEIVKEDHSKMSTFYNFKEIYEYSDNKNLNKWMLDKGFCCLIRNKFSKPKLEAYPDKNLIIYSMWNGYLDENNEAKNDDLIDFLKPYAYKHLHTSGHADIESLKKLVASIKPKYIIPIHTENPKEFQKHFKNTKILEDGVPFIT